MRTFLTILLLVTIILFSCRQTSQTPVTTGKLFIIGGGKRPPEMIQRMITEAELDKGGYIVILPMASSEPDTSVYYTAKQFIEHGVTRIADFRFTQELPATPGQLDSLRNASLIYITGGDQNRFMQAVAGTQVEAAIKECYQRGNMIAGTSAGAAVMSEKMITGNELKNRDYRETFRTIEAANLELGQGLGFLKTAIVDQHFVWRSRHNRLITAVIENPGIKGIGIDEATAILVKGNMAEVVGESQVLVFDNPDKSFRTNEQGKLGARYIRLQVLLPGESFKL